jgi:hypothetical protein
MTITKVLTPVAFVALIALSAAPVHAGQHRGESGRSASRSRGAGVSRGGSRGVVQSRGYSGYRGGVRGGYDVRGGGFVRSRSSFYRPYYSFRPRVSLGFGLWMGYPVPYPTYYDNPYGYAYPSGDPYAYDEPAPSYGYSQPYPPPGQSPGYPASNYPTSNYPTSNYPASSYPPSNYTERQSAPAIGMQRGGEQSAPGGISFEITPESAAVFVDGTYMGTAGEFGTTAEPLGLNAGRHHVEIRAAGYRTMTFDAEVRPAEVIPYQGTLQRN